MNLATGIPLNDDSIGRIRELIHANYDIDPATLDADKSLADFGLDSLSTAELIFAIEDHFGIAYPEDRTDVRTLAGLAAVVDEARWPAAADAEAALGARPAAAGAA